MKTDSLPFRLLRTAAIAILAALSMGDGCGHTPAPPRVSVQIYRTWVGVRTGAFIIVADTAAQANRYVIDWGDFTIDTTSSYYGYGETAYVEHSWTEAGVMAVKAQALSGSWRTRISDWSIPETVIVRPNGVPVVDSVHHTLTIVPLHEELRLTVWAHDPDSDSIRTIIDWGDGTDTLTGFLASPCSLAARHVFGQVESIAVNITVHDWKGAASRVESVLVAADTAAGVKWWWQSPEQGAFNTSPLSLYDGEEECIYGSAPWDAKFFSVRVRNGKVKQAGTPRWPWYFFTGHPAFGEATQHIIIGSEEGELYAFNLDLTCAWRWPNAPSESLEPLVQFGAPAIKDNRLYVPRDDESLYYFIDSIDHCVRVATLAANAGIVGAPVIDAQGNVYFGTDSGYLYKVGPELDTLFWRTRLIADGEIHSPVIGSDGTVYCGSDSFRLHAVSPDGEPIWALPLDGAGVRPALGRQSLFVASDAGTVYSVDPQAGSINWQRALAPGFGFHTTPIVAANGRVYFQGDNDVLYCVSQLDGTTVWACDCNSYLPGGGKPRPRRAQLNDYDPNPTITSTGDIIVPGQSAVFRVAGSLDGPLDPLAPWPKWQHDLFNTGYVGGGR